MQSPCMNIQPASTQPASGGRGLRAEWVCGYEPVWPTVNRPIRSGRMTCHPMRQVARKATLSLENAACSDWATFTAPTADTIADRSTTRPDCAGMNRDRSTGRDSSKG